MGKFNSRATLVLDRIYRFVGGKTLGRDFDTETPIQPVHDVSREAEVGAGFGQSLGFWNHNQFRVHPGVETYMASNDIWSQLTWYTNADPANSWNWIIGVTVNSTVYNQLNRVTVGLVYPAFGGSLPGSPGAPIQVMRPIFDGTTTKYIPDRTAAAAGVYVDNDDLNGPIGFPLYAPDGSTIGYRSSVTAAQTMNIAVLMWTGPKGVLPPGLA